MSAQFERIREYIDEYDGDEFVSIESGTPANEAALIRIAEAFSFPLPVHYREYLTTFGTLDIGGLEFAGASDTGYLSVVHLRNNLVEDDGFPDDLIPLLNEEGDSYVSMRADGTLLRWYPNGPDADVLDESLGEFLLRLCDELIEDEGGDD